MKIPDSARRRQPLDEEEVSLVPKGTLGIGIIVTSLDKSLLRHDSDQLEKSLI